MQKGRFSTVWLAQDFQHDTLVTLKFKRVHLYIWKLYKIKQQKPNLLEILQKIAQNVYKSIWIQSLKEYYANVQIICSNNVDDSHRLALLKKYINQRFAFQNFRISEISFQFLDCQRPTLINKLGIKCIMRNLRCILNQREKMKKRSNLIRILEEFNYLYFFKIEEYEESFNNLAQTRSYEGSNSQSSQQDKVIKKRGNMRIIV